MAIFENRTNCSTGHAGLFGNSPDVHSRQSKGFDRFDIWENGHAMLGSARNLLSKMSDAMLHILGMRHPFKVLDSVVVSATVLVIAFFFPVSWAVECVKDEPVDKSPVLSWWLSATKANLFVSDVVSRPENLADLGRFSGLGSSHPAFVGDFIVVEADDRLPNFVRIGFSHECVSSRSWLGLMPASTGIGPFLYQDDMVLSM